MFKQLKRDVIYQSEWITLFVDRVKTPTGLIVEKQHVAAIRDSVVGVVTNNKGQILMIEAYRYLHNAKTLEVPSGFIDDGETSSTAFVREIFEETGYVIECPKQTISYYPSNGISNQKIDVFTAKLKEEKQVAYDTDEIANVMWVDEQEVLELLLNDQLLCGLSITALQDYFLRKAKNVDDEKETVI